MSCRTCKVTLLRKWKLHRLARKSGKLQEVLFGRLTRGLESLSELYDRHPQNVTDPNQIYKVEASLASFIFADKCLFDSHRFCQLILCQIPLFSLFA